MSAALHRKWLTLSELLHRLNRVLVAFSGGCDSTLLSAAACRVLGKERVLVVTAVSVSLPNREKQATQELARRLDLQHRFVSTDEMQNPNYTANPANRCFFCKNELYSKLAPLARERGMWLVDGFNASDRSDFRPGFQASAPWEVRHPLDDAELTKADIRRLSRWLGLPTWNKPASPCLSSRIPYGTAVTARALHQVEDAEELLHEEGFDTVRVRHFSARARIEVPLKDVPRLQEPVSWARVVAGLKRIGFESVEVDPRGFQSGRLNEALFMKRDANFVPHKA